MLCICHPKEAFQIMLVFFFLLFIFICRQNCNMLCICHPKEAFQIMLVFFSCVCHPIHFFSCYSAGKIVICCVYVTLRKHFRSCWYFFSCYSYSFADKIVICCVYVTLRKHFRSCWYFFFLLFIFICRQNCNMLCICHHKEAFQFMLLYFFCYANSYADKIVICCVYVTLRKHFRSCWYFFSCYSYLQAKL